MAAVVVGDLFGHSFYGVRDAHANCWAVGAHSRRSRAATRCRLDASFPVGLQPEHLLADLHSVVPQFRASGEWYSDTRGSEICCEVPCESWMCGDRSQVRDEVGTRDWISQRVGEGVEQARCDVGDGCFRIAIQRENSASVMPHEVVHVRNQRREQESRATADRVCMLLDHEDLLMTRGCPKRWSRRGDQPRVGDEPLPVESSISNSHGVGHNLVVALAVDLVDGGQLNRIGRVPAVCEHSSHRFLPCRVGRRDHANDAIERAAQRL